MKIESGQHVAVLGVTGSGKTYWMRNSLIPLWRRVIVADTEDLDYGNLPSVKPKKALSLAKDDKAFRVRVVFTGNPSIDEPVMEDFCYSLLDQGHDLLFVVDEATDFSDAHRIPDGLRALIRKSRKRNITVAMATQRPAMLSKDVLTQSSHRVYFYLPDYDRAAVKPWAPWLEEAMPQAPYGSYRFLYQGPDGTWVVYQSYSKGEKKP
jgi:DNA helicase HerA-like ATPase